MNPLVIENDEEVYCFVTEHLNIDKKKRTPLFVEMAKIVPTISKNVINGPNTFAFRSGSKHLFVALPTTNVPLIPVQVSDAMIVNARVNIVKDYIGAAVSTSHEMEHIHNNIDQVKQFHDIPAHFVNEYNDYENDVFVWLDNINEDLHNESSHFKTNATSIDGELVSDEKIGTGVEVPIL